MQLLRPACAVLLWSLVKVVSNRPERRVLSVTSCISVFSGVVEVMTNVIRTQEVCGR